MACFQDLQSYYWGASDPKLLWIEDFDILENFDKWIFLTFEDLVLEIPGDLCQLQVRPTSVDSPSLS